MALKPRGRARGGPGKRQFHGHSQQHIGAEQQQQQQSRAHKRHQRQREDQQHGNQHHRAFFRRAACIHHAIDDAFGGAIQQGIHAAFFRVERAAGAAAREVAVFTAGGQRVVSGRAGRGVGGGIQQVCYRIGRVCRPPLAQQPGSPATQQQQIDGVARAYAERVAQRQPIKPRQPQRDAGAPHGCQREQANQPAMQPQRVTLAQVPPQSI